MSGEILICFSCFTKKFLLYNTFSSVNICKHKKNTAKPKFYGTCEAGEEGLEPPI